MAYNNDKEVIFALMCRVDYNKTWEEIDFGLDYDMGDYSFGKGDGKELRTKIVDAIKLIKIQFDKVFDEDDNTKTAKKQCL